MSAAAPEVLRAIASPRRCEILRLLWNRELNAGAVHAAMPDITFGAVSLHLRQLTEAGLVQVRADHRHRFYRGRKEGLGPLGRMLEQMWDDALWKLTLAAELEQTRRGPLPGTAASATPHTQEDPLMPATLPHALDRTVIIRATPDIVFRFFTDSDRWASWWGAGSSIDPRPGGPVHIRYPDGTEVSGEVIAIATPRRLIFTYGYVSGAPIAPGGSRVTIELQGHPAGTRLQLTHAFADAKVRDVHVQGWRYQLALFANIVANEVNALAGDVLDCWFAAWAIADDEERMRRIKAVVSPDVSLRDRFALVDSADDSIAHITAARRFMPGLELRRRGAVRHCQGVVLGDWIAVGSDGTERGGGTNVFVLGADGRIQSVTGFWNG